MSILALGIKQKKEKIPDQKNRKKAKKKKRKIPNQRVGESKKGKENSRSRIGRKQKKHAERSLDQTIFEQYRIVTK